MGGALSAICVGCTSKKRGPANSFLSQATLAPGDQDAVAEEWSARLRHNPQGHLVPAATLYAGQGVVRARGLAGTLHTRLFVISAGLGLVRDDTLVPAYDLTTANVPGAISEKITGPFSASQWWTAVQQGPYAVPMSALSAGEGRIVIALSQAYASMVGPWLASLPSTVCLRLRLLGARLDRELPASLVPQWIRYDSRLDTAVPGIRLHYAARAMEHFLTVCAGLSMADAAADQAGVDDAMHNVRAPLSPLRPRIDDDALGPMVVSAMARCGSMARALDHLRNVDGVACSDQRFRTLIHEARA